MSSSNIHTTSPPHILAHNPFPPFLHLTILAAAIITMPTSNEHPAYTCAPIYLPPDAVIMAPAIGGPMSVAKLHTENTMPMRTPVLRGSAVRLASPAGNSDWMPPAASP